MSATNKHIVSEWFLSLWHLKRVPVYWVVSKVSMLDELVTTTGIRIPLNWGSSSPFVIMRPDFTPGVYIIMHVRRDCREDDTHWLGCNLFTYYLFLLLFQGEIQCLHLCLLLLRLFALLLKGLDLLPRLFQLERQRVAGLLHLVCHLLELRWIRVKSLLLLIRSLWVICCNHSYAVATLCACTLPPFSPCLLARRWVRSNSQHLHCFRIRAASRREAICCLT